MATSRIENDWIGILVHRFKQVMKIVLSVLDACDEIQCFWPVVDFTSKHFQTRLASLKRIAAFVSQAGNRFSNGRKALGFSQCFFNLLPRGDIADRVETKMPSRVCSGLRLISTAISEPSLRRPYSSKPAPIGRK